MVRGLLAAAAALGLVFGAGGPAQAQPVLVEVVADEPGGLSMTVEHEGLVPRPVYDPVADSAEGPRKCQLRYHEYYPTDGCGGFTVRTTLHGVRDLPGYLAGNLGDDGFSAAADTARTFGCTAADGSFDWSTSFVVRTTQQPLSWVYYHGDAGWVVSAHRSDPTREFGPGFFLNFEAVDFTCPEGRSRVQYGLKVSNITVSTPETNDVFGKMTWRAEGPFYW
ncbi:hypothetical protein G6045_38735 [Streptomyces sp. YC504]|uniref:Secreted protein n=1 Tax=Streptomyces mesophilus TaxID=1775132 RepID=A0A6G4XWI8_9ACTN|nr:hypothetical protein [Streptomyces mesophilus]NGO81552.1 hypothetical protein [Streptomyces mesophilus]